MWLPFVCLRFFLNRSALIACEKRKFLTYKIIYIHIYIIRINYNQIYKCSVNELVYVDRLGLKAEIDFKG